MKNLRTLSLFSGCGGMDLGFLQAGYDIVYAIDNDKYAVQTYNANFHNKAILEDINNISLDSLPQFDVLIGGFPCQPFAIPGKRLGFQDIRGTLFFRIAEIIKSAPPYICARKCKKYSYS